jgi:bile acid-coenzyme A ligase
MRVSISRALTALADEDPDRLAVDDGTTRLDRRALEERSNRLAWHFLEAGVTPDAFVTVIGSNTVDTVVATVAAWKAGATPQPLSPQLPSSDREAVLDLVRPALVLTDQPMAGRRSMSLRDCGVGDGGAAVLPDAAARSWKAPTSSGSTGTPKVVVAAASAHVDRDGRVAAFVPRRATQLVAGPLHHAAPFVYAMRGLMTGHDLVLLPRFDADAWLAAVERHGVTWGMVVPTMMSRITALGPGRLSSADVSSLESVLHIGSVCPPHVKRAWIDWLGPDRVVEVYSGTESNGLTMITGREWIERPSSVGRPAGGSSVRVLRPDGTLAGPEEIGRIEFTRPGPATYRYLGRPEPEADSWHGLGDLGHLDDDGYLFLADRADDRIVSGGVDVWPAAVESVLETHPSVRSCVVVGVPDDDHGERVRAVVDVGDDDLDESALDEVALARWAAERLDPERRPREWVIVHEPLRDDTGKVRRSRWR